MILRDDRIVNLKYDDATSTFSVDTVDIKDFIFRKIDNPQRDYQIVYKDGITETLTTVGIERYVTTIAHENGYTLSLTYESAGDAARLTRIVDESNTSLLDITYTDGTDASGKATRDCVVELFKGDTTVASKMTFKVSDDGVSGLTLRSCEANLDDANTVKIFEFNYIPADSAVGFRVISQVTSDFAGPATETIRYGPQLKIPTGAPWTSIPAVTYYTFSMTSAGTGATKVETHEFTYGLYTEEGAQWDFSNFLGYEKQDDQDVPWDATAIDNIYNRGAAYQYTSWEKILVDGVELSTVKRTYDKFHRLEAEALVIPDVGPAVSRREYRTYTYAGSTSDAYASLPAQYRLPVQIEAEFAETTQIKDKDPQPDSRVTTRTMSYDEFGNVLQTIEAGGFTIDYEYYPAAGEPDNCPADPNGFVRYPKTVTRYKVDPTSDSSMTTCTYVSTQSKRIVDPAGDKAINYTVIQAQKETRKIAGADSSGYRMTKYEYFTDAMDAASLGRVKSTTLLLSSESGLKTSYTYALSADNSQLTIGTTQTGVDDTTLTESRTISCLTGAPLELTDNLGIRSSLVYDVLGRVTSYTRAQDSEYKRTVTYSYAVDATTKLHTTTTTEPAVNVVKTTMDALGNIVKEETGDKISRTWEYNTQGWLVAAHEFDYDVPAAGGTPTATLDLVDTFSYDAFGNLVRAVYHDNHEKVRHFNIGSAKLTEGINVPVRQAATDVVKVYDSTVTEHDPQTMLPLKIREFDVDSRTLRTETTLAYDAFSRIESAKVVDSATSAQSYVKMEYDFFDRLSKSVEYDGDTAGRTKELRYWAYGLDASRITDLRVDSVSVATQAYDGVGRLTEVNRNPAQTTQNLTKYEYDTGYVTPRKITTPRGIEIAYSWRPELGGVPTFIIPPVGEGGSFEYQYDSDLVKLTAQLYTSDTITQQRDLSYDQNALLISESYTLTPAEGIAGNYANAFSRTVLGRLKSVSRTVTSKTVTYPRGEVQYTYDLAGRVDGISFLSSGAVGLTLAISYSGGELANQVDYTFTRPDATTQTVRLTLSYDCKMRVTNKEYAWKGADGTYATCASSAASYNGLDRIVEQRFGGAAETTAIQHERDYLGRLIRSTLADTTTVYPKDPAGNDVSEYTFGYDQYDNIVASGSKARESGATTGVVWSYEGGKNVFELKQQTIGASSVVSFEYDASGNVTGITGPGGTVVTCLYDCYEKLRERQVSKPGQPLTSAIIAANSQGTIGSERKTNTDAETTTTSQPTAFGYRDGVLDASLRKQADGDTNVQLASYLRGAGGVDAIGCANGNPTDGFTKTQSMLFSDSFGSVYGNADPATGASSAITPAIYSPYGYQSLQGADPSYDPIGFKGERFDQLTGLYHLGDGVRAYDSAGMRFLQYDPLSPFDRGGLNPYGFCGGDPITFSDPTGHARALPWSIAPAMAAVGFFTGIAGLAMGVFGLIGGGITALAALSFAGGAIGAAGGSTGLAATLVGNSALAADLTLASTVLGGVGLAIDLVPFSMQILGFWIGPRIVERFSTARVLSVNSDFVPFSGTDAAFASRRAQVHGGDAIQFALPTMVHGKVGKLKMPQPTGNFIDGIAQHSAEWTDIQTAAARLTDFYTTQIDDPNGSIFLVACGGTISGAKRNAQALADFTGRTVIAFPSSFVGEYSDLATNLAETAAWGEVKAFGWPWFPKAMTFTPAAGAGT
ncbi:RHS repeat-associated core domain-containing protein [Paraburkholderia rhizosphaerae]|uniref:RHS repeat-associated core domain-containing protein n=1 Tax=Paraburkholderia rhizosphaerae TaxID=480658 RepID=UPI001AB02FD2|nr:RHS repeat-associated core domain-containing protein [Paraburkholderia rhizosphaerae]